MRRAEGHTEDAQQELAFLASLRRLWQQEQRAVADRFREQRQQLNLKERIERGLALRGLSVEEMDAAPGERLRLWLRTSVVGGLGELRFGPGDPVLLWRESPDEREAVRGVVARRRGDLLGVIVDGDGALWLEEEDGFKLDLADTDTTFKRGFFALRRFEEAARDSDRGRLRAVLFGKRTPQFKTISEPERWHDEHLNDAQRQAVRQAMAAQDVALIHGPPGTGKTRTLVEVIRQAAARGEKVLATAASNAAVDNLAERLVQAGVSVVRLGHPARVSEAVQGCTLDALLEASDLWHLTRRWVDEANTIRRRADTRSTRSNLSFAEQRAERRAAFQEANGLMRDARRNLAGLQNAILDRAQVICATAAGADSPLIERRAFALVVVDEATQAPDPMLLVPLSQGERVVLAGDPCQLPPTVISQEAESAGLGTTVFDRLTAQVKTKAKAHNKLHHPQQAEAWALLHCMLEVQHRMHESLMFFPSESKYEGRLIASPEVAQHVLHDLPNIQPDPLRPGPLVLIDTAGKGWHDERLGTQTVKKPGNDFNIDPSIQNPNSAARAAAEVFRLISRGAPPKDIALITPYDAQARALRRLLVDVLPQGLEVGTIDGFQGREKEAIVLDLVRSNDDSEIGFLKDTRRMNVALTRARRQLIVIGDSTTLGQHPYYKQFLDSAELLGAWVSAWSDDAEPIL